VAGTAHLGDLALGELVMPASATRGDTAGAGSIMVCCPALAPKAFVCHSVQFTQNWRAKKKTPPFFQNKSCKIKVESVVNEHLFGFVCGWDGVCDVGGHQQQYVSSYALDLISCE
jgi:hypothetical protein